MFMNHLPARNQRTAARTGASPRLSLLLGTGLILGTWALPALSDTPPTPEAQPTPTPTPTPTPAPAPAPTSTPSPAAAPADASATAPEPIALRQRLETGDLLRYRLTQRSVDERSGPTIGPRQQRSESSAIFEITFTIEAVFPKEQTIRGRMKFDRVMIEASTPGGVERFDTSDPSTYGSALQGAAAILQRDINQFVFSARGEYLYNEHQRLRSWHPEGVNLLDNVIGQDAFTVRFGPLFTWFKDEARPGETWSDARLFRNNSQYRVELDRTFRVEPIDDLTARIVVSGGSKASPDAADRNLQFGDATIEATYVINRASALVRTGESKMVYRSTYQWQGQPATVTSTVTEKLERLD